MKACWIRASGIALALAAAAQAQTTTLASLGIPTQSNDVSQVAAISADGRYIAFESWATNLVVGDTNGYRDIFVHDRLSGGTERMSVGAGGVQGNADSQAPSISADGRYVAFWGFASNLVPGDTNSFQDVFVRDRQLGTTEIVSLSSSGAQGNNASVAPAISSDGRYVAFWSDATNFFAGDTNGVGDVFVRDRQTGTTECISIAMSGATGNAISWFPSISSDGRYVGFMSNATDLVPGDTNGMSDVFVRDRLNGTTERVSVADGGAQANNGCFCTNAAISGDGRYVVFDSEASNLVAGDTNAYGDVFVRDRVAGTTRIASISTGGGQQHGGVGNPSISPDGRFVVFYSPAADLVAGDTNGGNDVFVRDLVAGTTERASLGNGGVEATASCVGPAVSSGALFVAFETPSPNLVAGDTNGVRDVFVRDRSLATTTRVSSTLAAGNSYSQQPALSADGTTVAFSSNAANLVANDTNGFLDVFVFDRSVGLPVRVSLSTTAGNSNGPSDVPAVSGDGRYVAFRSEATNLVANDTNGQRDGFVRDLQTGTTDRISLATGGAQADDTTIDVAISSDGRYVAFSSFATNLVGSDTNGQTDVFVRDRQLATTTRASIASNGSQGNSASYACAISGDGGTVAYQSDATTLVPADTNAARDIFVRNLQAGTTVRASVASDGTQANSDSYGPPSLSANGRYVAFSSDATNLVAGDTNSQTDVFVRDLVSGVTERVSVGTGGTQASGGGFAPSISSDGRFVAFSSASNDLVTGDTNGHADVFIHDRLTGATTRASLAQDGSQANGDAVVVSISADGRVLAFQSSASNLVPNDDNTYDDVFIRDRGAASSFAPFCFGDGTGAACPCANNGAPGHGCENSSTTGGAVLSGTGVASLSADTVHLTASGEKPTATSVLLSGGATVNSLHYGDGLRCVGGTLKRLYTHNAVGGVVTMPQGADGAISARSAASGDVIQAGSTRIYQIYYRDPIATFCPTPNGSTFNISNAIAIAWGD